MEKKKQSLGKSEGVIDFQSMRQNKIEERRREYERLIFNNSMGMYCVLDHDGLSPVDLVDISEGGLSIECQMVKSFKKGDVLKIRMYFASENYLPVEVKVMNITETIKQSTFRLGCMIDKSLASYSAIFHLVQFVLKCAEHGRQDNQQLKILY